MASSYEPEKLGGQISPADPRYQELVRLALQRLRGGADRDDVVRLVAERGALTWPAAEQIVGDVERSHRRGIGASTRALGLLLAGTVVLGSLALVALFVGAALSTPPTLAPQSGSQNHAFGALLSFLGGVGMLCTALFDWDWFFASRKARRIVALLGRQGTRVFYGLLGCLLLGLSAYLARVG
jgi:hypothetical protein